MKKFLALSLTLSMAVTMLTACGGTTASEAPAEEATPAPEVEADAEEVSESTSPEYVFKYAELNGDDNINAKVGYEFAKYVSELTDGRIEIEIYSSGTLGDEKTCLNALQMGGGTVDLFRGNTNSMIDYGFEKTNLFGLPFVFRSRDAMWTVLEDENLGQAFLNEGVEVGAGMVGIAYTDEGARHLFTTSEITCLADIQGMKIRVPETAMMMDTMTALGAQPTPISYSELYSSLQTSVVDGAENGLSGYDSNKFYEVAPYYLMDGHTFSPGVIFMAEAQWNKLSAEDQAALKEAGRMASEWNKDQIVAEEEALAAGLVEKGVTIIEVPEEDMVAVQEACKSVWADYSVGIEDVLQAVIDIQG